MGIKLEGGMGQYFSIKRNQSKRERLEADADKHKEQIDAWLLKNQAEYDGKFVALCDGQLVATGDTYAELIEEIIDDANIENYTIKKVGKLVG